MFNKGGATGATSGTRTAYNSREPEFILVFLWLMLLNLLSIIVWGFALFSFGRPFLIF
jgi:hypothetical protein